MSGATRPSAEAEPAEPFRHTVLLANEQATRDLAMDLAVGVAANDIVTLAGDLGGPGGNDFGAGMSMAIRCQDGYMDALARQVAEEHAEQPVLARAFTSLELAAEAPAACAQAGLPMRTGADYAPLQTDLPIVVANGAWDPVTPPPLARYVADRLGNARYVEFPHAGHGPTRSLECGGEFLNAFFDDPAAPLKMDCVEEGGKAATYFAPYWATQAFARGAAFVAEQPRKALLPHLAWAGLAFGIALLGLVVLLFAWLGRRLDRAPRPAGSLPRWATGLAALATVGHGAGIGVAAALAARATPAMLVFGLLGWAVWAAWAAPVAGALGLLALVLVLAGGQGRAGKLACGLVALYQLFRLSQVRTDRRQAVFTLERNRALRQLYGIFTVALALLLMDCVVPAERRRLLGLGASAMTFALFLYMVSAATRGGEPRLAFGGMFVQDGLSVFFKALFLLAGSIVLALAVDWVEKSVTAVTEYFVLILLALVGMLLAASANHFAVLYVALELVTVPFYILTSYQRSRAPTLEAGVKYLILGALSSAFTVYGIALCFGASGTMSFATLAERSADLSGDRLFQLGMLMVLGGLAFKVSLFPFQVWAPDVYEASPAPTTAFLAIGSKAAGVVLLVRRRAPRDR